MVLLAAGAAQLGFQAWRAAVTYCADRRNPYIYAQTSPDVLNLVDLLQSMVQVQPQGRHLLVKVISPGSDYWPLPWYLRDFDRVGWWDKLPADLSAPVLIVSTRLNARLDADHSHLLAGIFQLRPDAFLELYVQTNLWSSYIGSKR